MTSTTIHFRDDGSLQCKYGYIQYFRPRRHATLAQTIFLPIRISAREVLTHCVAHTTIFIYGKLNWEKKWNLLNGHADQRRNEKSFSIFTQIFACACCFIPRLWETGFFFFCNNISRNGICFWLKDFFFFCAFALFLDMTMPLICSK